MLGTKTKGQGQATTLSRVMRGLLGRWSDSGVHTGSYIPEIDVLRAVAVAAVVLFHAGLPFFKGGFLGVDVFFVISGFLIARIYATSGVNYSALAFYRRRFLRIIPALIAMILLVLPFVWLVRYGAVFSQYLRNALYSLLFVANFDFWNHVDYFGPTNDEVPLLHVWSLSVEEQFYLVAPLILFCFRRFRSMRGLLAAALILSSLILSLVLDRFAPDAGFFLMPSRFWELAAGAVVAFLPLPGGIRPGNRLASLGGAVLLVLMLVLFMSFGEEYTVQTIGRLIAVLLAAAYLALFGRGDHKMSLAGIAPLRGLGKISYSLYLWHNPLLALLSLQLFRPSTPIVVILTVCLSVVLAIISYTLIENPWRRLGRATTASQALSSSLVGALLILLLIGVPGYLATGGFRFDARAKLVLEEAQTPVPAEFSSHCFLEGKSGIASFPQDCKSAIGPQSTLVWGDSFAHHLAMGLRTVRPDIEELSAAVCPPTVHIFFRGNPRCEGLNDQAIAEIARAHPARVILTAYWSHAEDFNTSLAVEKTVQEIKAKSPETEIILVGSPPIWRPNLSRLILRNNVPLEQDDLENRSLGEVAASDVDLKAVAERNGLRFISLKDMLCHGNVCRSWVNTLGRRALVTMDLGHFTYDGSVFVARQLSLGN